MKYKKELIFILGGILLNFILLNLEANILKVSETYYTLLMLPIFVLYSFYLGGQFPKKRILTTSVIMGLVFCLISIIGRISDAGAVNPINVLLYVLIGIAIGGLGAFLRSLAKTKNKMIGIIVILVGIAGGMYWMSQAKSMIAKPFFSPAYKTYTSEEAGFSLKYPATVEFYESGDSVPVEFDQTALEVYSIKMDEKQIENDESTPIDKKIELKKAAQGLPFDQDAVFKEEHVPGRVGYQVINIGKSNVKASVETYLMGERVAEFIRFLVFYHNGYEVHIVLTGDHASIISDSPAFFKDAFNGYSYWEDDNQKNTANGNRETPKMREFYDLLESDNGPEVAQRWYSDFDLIVDSIEFK